MGLLLGPVRPVRPTSIMLLRLRLLIRRRRLLLLLHRLVGMLVRPIHGGRCCVSGGGISMRIMMMAVVDASICSISTAVLVLVSRMMSVRLLLLLLLLLMMSSVFLLLQSRWRQPTLTLTILIMVRILIMLLMLMLHLGCIGKPSLCSMMMYHLMLIGRIVHDVGTIVAVVVCGGCGVLLGVIPLLLLTSRCRFGTISLPSLHSIPDGNGSTGEGNTVGIGVHAMVRMRMRFGGGRRS